MTTQENWEEEFKDFYYETGEFENRTRGFQAYIEFIRNLLQDHNNSLIEEIEKLKEEDAHLQHELKPVLDIVWKGALDTVIIIIKQK